MSNVSTLKKEIERPKREKKVSHELQTLFKLCLDFVAENAFEIESLEGFPIQMGEQIWNACIETKSIFGPRSAEIIDTFVEAYESEMLSSLKLSDLMVLNNHEDGLKSLMKYCTVIDLSNCGIDEDHDVLNNITETCRDLQTLKLNNNRLSSKSLRLLFGTPTLPRNRLRNLKTLEIFDNEKVTVKGIYQYVILICTTLEKIVFSWKDPGEADKTFAKKWRKVPYIGLENDNQSHGMASPLINLWIRNNQEKIRAKQRKLQSSSASDFYGAKVPSQKTFGGSHHSKDSKITLPKLCYVRNESPSNENIIPSAKKRKANVLEKEIHDTEEDMILNLYK